MVDICCMFLEVPGWGITQFPSPGACIHFPEEIILTENDSELIISAMCTSLSWIFMISIYLFRIYLPHLQHLQTSHRGQSFQSPCWWHCSVDLCSADRTSNVCSDLSGDTDHISHTPNSCGPTIGRMADSWCITSSLKDRFLQFSSFKVNMGRQDKQLGTEYQRIREIH